MKRKKEMNFQSLDSLQSVVNILNEATEALGDKARTIKESAIPEVLAGALGAGIGGVGSFAALYGLGTVGLSAAGITSGLATAGAVAGGGMVTGVFVLAAPIAILAGTGIMAANHLKKKQLFQEEHRFYIEALKLLHSLEKELQETSEDNEERKNYIKSLLILLKRMMKDLEEDLGLDK